MSFFDPILVPRKDTEEEQLRQRELREREQQAEETAARAAAVAAPEEPARVIGAGRVDEEFSIGEVVSPPGASVEANRAIRDAKDRANDLRDQRDAITEQNLALIEQAEQSLNGQVAQAAAVGQLIDPVKFKAFKFLIEQAKQDLSKFRGESLSAIFNLEDFAEDTEASQSGINKLIRFVDQKNTQIQKLNELARKKGTALFTQFQRETDFLTGALPIPGPGLGPAPDSIGEGLQRRVADVLEFEELVVDLGTLAIGETSTQLLSEAKRLKSEGLDVEAGIALSISGLFSAGEAFIEGATLPFRPLAIGKTIETVGGLGVEAAVTLGEVLLDLPVSDKPLFTAVRKGVEADPLGVLVSLPSAFIGGELAGRAVARALRGPPEVIDIEQVLPFESEAGLLFPQPATEQASIQEAVLGDFIASGETVTSDFDLGAFQVESGAATEGFFAEQFTRDLPKSDALSLARDSKFDKVFRETGAELETILLPEGLDVGRPAFRPKIFTDIVSRTVFDPAITLDTFSLQAPLPRLAGPSGILAVASQAIFDTPDIDVGVSLQLQKIPSISTTISLTEPQIPQIGDITLPSVVNIQDISLELGLQQELRLDLALDLQQIQEPTFEEPTEEIPVPVIDLFELTEPPRVSLTLEREPRRRRRKGRRRRFTREERLTPLPTLKELDRLLFG